MKISKNEGDDLLEVCVEASRIDAAAALSFKDALRSAAEKSKVTRVVLDLKNVDFIDSSGLGAIVAVMKLFAPDKRLELAALQPNVERVFRLTRMDQVFEIHDTVSGTS